MYVEESVSLECVIKRRTHSHTQSLLLSLLLNTLHIMPYINIKRLFLLCVSITLRSAVASSYGAHGRRYSAYDYDMGVSQFTPDGRLLQVEYAANACHRAESNPIVSVGINSPEGTILIMATISSPPPSSLASSQNNPSRNGQNSDQGQEREEDVESFVKEKHQRAQFRIIEVPLSSLHGQTSTILVGLSGILSDATSLLQVAYSQLEEEQSTYGWHRLGLSPVGINTLRKDKVVSSSAVIRSRHGQSQSIIAQPSETVMRLSRAIADKCQSHAFGGGLRPIGASLLLAGFDNTLQIDDGMRGYHGARIAMCETHPNGGCRSLVSTGKSRESRRSASAEVEVNENSVESNAENTVETAMNHPQVMVSGGAAQYQHELKSSLESRLRLLYQSPFGVRNASSNSNDAGEGNTGSVERQENENDTQYVQQALRTVISSMVDEWKSRGDPLSPSSTGTPASSQSNDVGSGIHDEQARKSVLPQMEVVVASSKQGTCRLSEGDIAKLIKPLK